MAAAPAGLLPFGLRGQPSLLREPPGGAPARSAAGPCAGAAGAASTARLWREGGPGPPQTRIAFSSSRRGTWQSWVLAKPSSVGSKTLAPPNEGIQQLGTGEEDDGDDSDSSTVSASTTEKDQSSDEDDSLDENSTEPAAKLAPDEGDTEEEELIEVGVIAGAHGLKGELRIHAKTDFPEERFGKVLSSPWHSQHLEMLARWSMSGVTMLAMPRSRGVMAQ
eukprot:SM000131S26709  [mRNA]  locus=s131:86610:87479:- [translate_table: standard]